MRRSQETERKLTGQTNLFYLFIIIIIIIIILLGRDTKQGSTLRQVKIISDILSWLTL